MLINATETTAAYRVALHVEVAIGRYTTDYPELAGLDTAALQISEERPKTAIDTRQAAVAVFGYKHLYLGHPHADMWSDLEAMRKLGRTERWQNALTAMGDALLEWPDNLDWALHQYMVYTNYAAF